MRFRPIPLFFFMFHILVFDACPTADAHKDKAKPTTLLDRFSNGESKKVTKQSAQKSSEKEAGEGPAKKTASGLSEKPVEKRKFTKKGVGKAIAHGIAGFFEQSVNDAVGLFPVVVTFFYSDLSSYFKSTSYMTADTLTFVIEHQPETYGDRDQYQAYQSYYVGQDQPESQERTVLGQSRGAGGAMTQIKTQQLDKQRRIEQKRREIMFSQMKYTFLHYPFGFSGCGNVTQGFKPIRLRIVSGRLASFLEKLFLQGLGKVKVGQMAFVDPESVFLLKSFLLATNFEATSDAQSSSSRKGTPSKIRPIKSHELMAQLAWLYVRLQKSAGYQGADAMMSRLAKNFKMYFATTMVVLTPFIKFLPKALTFLDDLIKPDKPSMEYTTKNFGDFGQQVVGTILKVVRGLKRARQLKNTTMLKQRIKNALISVFKQFATYKDYQKEVQNALKPGLDVLLSPLRLKWSDVDPTAQLTMLKKSSTSGELPEELQFDLLGELIGYDYLDMPAEEIEKKKLPVDKEELDEEGKPDEKDDIDLDEGKKEDGPTPRKEKPEEKPEVRPDDVKPDENVDPWADVKPDPIDEEKIEPAATPVEKEKPEVVPSAVVKPDVTAAKKEKPEADPWADFQPEADPWTDFQPAVTPVEKKVTKVDPWKGFKSAKPVVPKKPVVVQPKPTREDKPPVVHSRTRRRPPKKRRRPSVIDTWDKLRAFEKKVESRKKRLGRG